MALALDIRCARSNGPDQGSEAFAWLRVKAQRKTLYQPIGA